MATNKVVYGDRTLIDLTSDSVTPGSLLQGETAHDRSGAQITGTLSDFTGATASTAGTHGLVPAPAAGDEDKVLKGNGTWGEASSSGHTILNSQGQQVPARSNLQFGKSVVTDDETNDITKVNVNNAIEKTYAEFQNMTPTERADGSVYYIPDYPTLGNVFFFRTVDAMQAAIQHGDVPNNAICVTTADYPYEAKAEDVIYDNTTSELESTNLQDAVDEIVEGLDGIADDLSDLSDVVDGKQDTLTNPLTQSDVVNNLTSTSTVLPLSAAQGKVLNDCVLKNNNNQQSVNSDTNYNRFTIGSGASPEGLVELRCDAEGGNISIKKGNLLIEIDTAGMTSADDTGYARLYIYNPTTGGIKQFLFGQNGSFSDGNGISTGFEYISYTAVNESRFTPDHVSAYIRNGIVNYTIVLPTQSTAWSGAWVKIGTFAKVPPITIYPPICDGRNALTIGYCTITNGGELLVYSPQITVGCVPVINGSFIYV